MGEYGTTNVVVKKIWLKKFGSLDCSTKNALTTKLFFLRCILLKDYSIITYSLTGPHYEMFLN